MSLGRPTTSSSPDDAAAAFFEEVIDVKEDDDEEEEEGHGDGQKRTTDVKSDGSFAALMLSPEMQVALKRAGFARPSPVQTAALPVTLMGIDVLVQAKSGTGKTLVFATAAVEGIRKDIRRPQKLIVAPTREIAHQIEDTIKRIAPKSVRTAVFTGGVDVRQDRERLRKLDGIQIIVGSPGRLCDLLKRRELPVDAIDFLALDEADQLMGDFFRSNVNFIFSSLPLAKQLAVFSATYPPELAELLKKYMRQPAKHVRLNSDDVQLEGVRQYVALKYTEQPFESVLPLVEAIHFRQAVVFVNRKEDCPKLAKSLSDAGQLGVEHTSAELEQAERQRVMVDFKSLKCRILVTSDLTARGIDSRHADLVVNVGPPMDSATYLHRIGRAARFGAYGAAVTLLANSREVGFFINIVLKAHLRVKRFDYGPGREKLPTDLTTNADFWETLQMFDPNPNGPRAKAAPKPLRSLENESGDRQAKIGPPRNIVVDDTPLEDELDRLTSAKPTTTFGEDLKALAAGFSAVRLNKKLAPVVKELPKQVVKKEEVEEEEKMDKRNLLSEDLTPMPLSTTEAVLKMTEHPPKAGGYKFVASRNRVKRQYYLRGELLRIREAWDLATWRKYLEERYPNVPTEYEDIWTGGIAKGEQTATDDVDERVDECVAEHVEGKPGTAEQVHQNAEPKQPLQTYSRDELLSVRKSKSARAWETFARSRFDASMDVFEWDARLRCAVEKQYRIRWDDERKERKKMVATRQAERKKQEAERTFVVASARTPPVRTTISTGWEEIALKTNLEIVGFDMNPQGQRKGPVVRPRRETRAYHDEISELSALLEAFNAPPQIPKVAEPKPPVREQREFAEKGVQTEPQYAAEVNDLADEDEDYGVTQNHDSPTVWTRLHSDNEFGQNSEISSAIAENPLLTTMIPSTDFSTNFVAVTQRYLAMCYRVAVAERAKFPDRPLGTPV